MTPSEDSSNNPSQGFVDTASSIWCTAEGQGSAQLGSHVELIFTEPIVVEFFKSEGQIDTWVSNFSIQYSTTESGDDFMKYGVLEPSQVNNMQYLYVCTFLELSTQKTATILQQSCCGATILLRISAFFCWLSCAVSVIKSIK